MMAWARLGFDRLFEEELRSFDHELGDQRSFYLVERFVPGDAYNVDSIVYENETCPP